ncbi:phage portal protein [Vannielia litorea]|uniref:phage portal protein n=1 Tax=Vannielia litorea TaxID=1217970 RepID=UPI001BCCB3ED|nr:phage portal protein [Vannielia litorea]
MSKPRRPLAARLNDLIAPISPAWAARRQASMVAYHRGQALAAHYDGTGRGARGADFRRNRTDAVLAGRYDRESLSFVVRDMLRNNPVARRAQRQLMNGIVGQGIVPSVHVEGAEVEGSLEAELKAEVERLWKAHAIEGRHIDAGGNLNLFSMQGLVAGTVVGDGEVLLRRRFRRPSDGHPLNFQVQVLEADFLDAQVDGDLGNGRFAVEGIEFNPIGQRVAYHIYEHHPGGARGMLPKSRRIPAENIIHVFDVMRPGQERGMSWFAPVITLLHDLHKYQDAQVKRQEVASQFAAFWKTEKPQDLGDTAMSAGAIIQIPDDEDVIFTDPPSVDGYEPFMAQTIRTIAAAMGLTYEQLSGDLRRVNYTSHRAGRMATDPNIADWQRNMMIGRVCRGLEAWMAEAVQDMADIPPTAYRIDWTPPRRPQVDPGKDTKADADEVAAGFASRREKIRERGKEPEKVEAEIREERSALPAPAPAAAPKQTETEE